MAPDVIVAGLLALAAVALLVWREVVHLRERARLTGALVEAQAKLTERNGLAAVGEMVSSLAQDLKTPLQEVLGNTELMLATTHIKNVEQPPVTLQQIRDGAERAAGIVRNLVTYTETVSLSRRWHDINDIIDRAVAMARHDLEANGVRLER